jgi:hypothetical protein
MSAVWAKSLGVDEFGDETAHGLGVTPWMGGPWSLASLAYSDSASSELSISSLDIEDSSSRSSSTACTRGLREVARTSFRSLGCPMMVSAGDSSARIGTGEVLAGNLSDERFQKGG